MENFEWYTQLLKPKWAPPSWLFGPVWTVIYIIIFSTFGYTLLKIFKKEYPKIILLPLALNLIFNFAFTPIQFGLKNNLLAAVDIILVLFTLIWFIFIVYPYNKWVSLSNIPYLLWVSFATILQLTITYLNSK